MKTYTFGLSFILLPLLIIAQSNAYHPFPDSGIIWVQSSWVTDFSNNPPFVIHDDNNLFISGDTTFGNFTYHKLYANGHRHAEPFPGEEFYYNKYSGAFRNEAENRKVYFLSQGQDVLAYDFNLTVGDTLPESPITNELINIVDSIDSVLVGGTFHKRFLVRLNDGETYASIIEGIGSTCGAFSMIQPVFEFGDELWCARQDDNIVWNYDTEFPCLLLVGVENTLPVLPATVFPNPTNGIFVIRTSVEYDGIEVYNDCGKLILATRGISSPVNLEGKPEGIYLVKLLRSGIEFSIAKVILKR